MSVPGDMAAASRRQAKTRCRSMEKAEEQGRDAPWWQRSLKKEAVQFFCTASEYIPGSINVKAVMPCRIVKHIEQRTQKENVS